MEHKKWKKLLVMLLVAIMIVQNSFGVVASSVQKDEADITVVEETTTETTTEVATEATIEATTEVATEATTEATTEVATEATTEATTEVATEATTEALAEEVTTMEEDETEPVSETTTETLAEKEVTTATTEFVEETEEKTKVKYKYEDSRVKISAAVKAEANLPEDAVLKADYIQPGTPEYREAVRNIESQMNKEGLTDVQHVCYDIYFEANGVEIEPEAGMVKVIVDYKDAVLRGNENTEYAVYHIDDQTKKVEEVTTKIKINEAGAVTAVGFSTKSFSVFTVTSWEKSETYIYDSFGIAASNTAYTSLFTVNLKDDEGKVYSDLVAYCVESSRQTPEHGNNHDIESGTIQDTNLRKILYYGYGGQVDAYTSFFKNIELTNYTKSDKNNNVNAGQQVNAFKEKVPKDFGYCGIETDKADGKLATMTSEQVDKLKSIIDDIKAGKNTKIVQEFYYTMTHIAASIAYNVSTNTPWPLDAGAWGTNVAGRHLAYDYYLHLISKEIPSVTNVNFTVNDTTITLHGTPSNAQVQITVPNEPNGIKYIYERNTYKSGDTFALKVGESFKFAVPKKLHGAADSVMTDSSKFTVKVMDWQAIVLNNKDSSYQDIGTMALVNTDKNIDFQYKWQLGEFIIKKVDENGNLIKKEGITFNVYGDEECKNYLGQIKTDSSGVATGVLEFSGEDDKVYLQEENAPKGYELSSKVLEVNVIDGVEAEYKNNTIYGSIKVVKTADTDNITSDKAGKALEGVTFTLYADEDIMTAYDSNELLYAKDAVIASKVTDADGTISFEGLLPGKYYVKETAVPAGYVLDDTKHALEVTEATLAVEKDITNCSQQMNLKIVKTDEEDTSKVLAGAEFGFYTKQDVIIKGVEYKTDELVGTVVTDTDGVAALSGLPIGAYYAKETKAPVGYILSDAIIEFASAGDETGAVLSSSKNCTNTQFHLNVNKYDLGGEKELDGAEITLKAAEDIYDADGKILYANGDVIDTWISKVGEVKDFGSKIVVGASYIFEETKTPEGYACFADVQFSVAEDGTVTIAEEYMGQDGKIALKDDITRVTIHKVDEDGKPVAGAKLVIKDAQGNVILNSDGTPRYSFTSRDEAIELGNIPAGDYILSEIEAPDGYQVSADVPFTVDDTNGAVNTVTMTDKKTQTKNGKITITKTITIGDLEVPIVAEEAKFYVALFSDEARTQRVSDVKEIVFKNQKASTVEFSNLAEGTYYIGETDEYGILIDSNAGDVLYVPQYTDGITAEITSTVFAVEKSINNKFIDFRDGYYYDGTITITKKVLKGTSAWNTNNVYYAGVFTDPNYTSLLTAPVKLEMNGASEASATVTVALGEDPKAEVKYYVTETDANGIPVANAAQLEYVVNVDKAEVVISGMNNAASVVITNTYAEEATGTTEATETTTEEEEAEKEETTESTKTGDNTPLFIYLFVMAVAAVTFVIILARRRDNME